MLLTQLLILSAVAIAPPASAATTTYTYEVRGRGNATSLENFAAHAAQTYADGRGWGLGGSIRFVRVPSGGDFTLWLSAPQHLPAFSSGCSTQYSCRVGRNVIINEARFTGATSAWNGVGGSLRDYQHMVVNHETGHWLGFGHAFCSGNGRPAPVMQQQSKGMQGCRPNPWPTPEERSTLSRRTGAPIIVAPPPVPESPLVPAGTVVVVPIAGAPGTGVPADAKAVGVNVTVTRPQDTGYLTVFPCGSPVPPTSNLNFGPGQTVAAFTLAAPGTGGQICARASQSAHIVMDVSGYVPASAKYRPNDPVRLMDTRRTGDRVTRPVMVALPPGARAGAITVTVTDPARAGFVTVHPCGTRKPLASTINFTAGQSVANLSLAAAGERGRVCLTPSVATHLVVDLVGTFDVGSGFAATSPRRIIDTRLSAPLANSVAVPLLGANPHALNLTITGSAESGWARVFPCGGPEPHTSNINFGAGQIIANAVLARPGADGRLCVRASTGVHLILDDAGALSSKLYVATPPVRVFESRNP